MFSANGTIVIITLLLIFKIISILDPLPLRDIAELIRYRDIVELHHEK